MKVSTLRTRRSCQIPKHARLRTHHTSENPTSHARSLAFFAGQTSTFSRRRELAGDAVSSPDLDPAGFLSFSFHPLRNSAPVAGNFGTRQSSQRSSEEKTDLWGVRHLKYDLHLKGNLMLKIHESTRFFLHFIFFAVVLDDKISAVKKQSVLT